MGLGEVCGEMDFLAGLLYMVNPAKKLLMGGYGYHLLGVPPVHPRRVVEGDL